MNNVFTSGFHRKRRDGRDIHAKGHKRATQLIGYQFLVIIAAQVALQVRLQCSKPDKAESVPPKSPLTNTTNTAEYAAVAPKT